LIPWLEEMKGTSLAMTKAKASPVTAHASLCSAVQGLLSDDPVGTHIGAPEATLNMGN
jgi:hypothetical protein